MTLGVLIMLFTLPSEATIKPCGKAPPPRSSPCRPSQAEIKEIMALVKAGNAHHSRYLDASAKEQGLRDADRGGREIDLEAWSALLERAQDQKALMEAAYQDALTKTGELYGVRPTNLSGGITGGLLKHGRAAWQPMMHVDRRDLFPIPTLSVDPCPAGAPANQSLPGDTGRTIPQRRPCRA